MGLQRLLLAAEVQAVEEEPTPVAEFLDGLTLERVLDPKTWPDLMWFGQIEPAGDLLPIRTNWFGDARGIGQAHLRHSRTPLWYAGPDLAASTLRLGELRGRLIRVIRLEATRLTPDLKFDQAGRWRDHPPEG